MENFYFSHAEQTCQQLDIPTHDNIMEWMKTQIGRLCQDDVIWFNDMPYRHIHLDEFIYDMNKVYQFDLTEIFEQYQSELWKVVLQRSIKLADLLKTCKIQ